MKNKENALLIIDPQNDFVDISGAALPVAGASEDLKRVARFIMTNLKSLSKIIVTLDSHRVVDVSHPSGWVDAQGKPVGPFTPISHQDVLDGKYSWTLNPQWVLRYTESLEKSGQFMHFLWPEHCIIGSWGHNVYQPLADAVHAWERQCGGISGAEYVTKGSHPLTEHFGAFQAQVPIENEPGTQPRLGLIKTLQQYNLTFIGGEALSHCLGSSLKQLLDLAPELAPKLVVLTDCTSDVTGFEGQATPIMDMAKSMGVKFALSTDPIAQAAAAVI